MSFQNNLCDLGVLCGEYVTAITARSTSPSSVATISWPSMTTPGS